MFRVYYRVEEFYWSVWDGQLMHLKLWFMEKWGFPKIRGTFLGVLMIRTKIFWDLYWGSLIKGNYQISLVSGSEIPRSCKATLPANQRQGSCDAVV